MLAAACLAVAVRPGFEFVILRTEIWAYPAIPLRARTLVSTLAVIGFSHLWVVLGWFVPFNLAVSLQAETGPGLPSYMRDGVCGTGTDYACPSEYVPVPGPDSFGSESSGV